MNFSIVIIYSNDRYSQFKNSIECWEECDGFNECEKIVCVDGKAKNNFVNWKIIEIKRKRPFFCWADSLNNGVSLCNNNIVFYMDSDRIVTKDFFIESIAVIKENENSFVYPKYLYSLKIDANANRLKNIRDNINENYVYLEPDHRQTNPLVFRKKNPFSGCVCFEKSNFLKCGGFDPRFCGRGYPDYDFMMNVISRNLKMIPIDKIELHQKHEYEGNNYKNMLQGLWNMKQYSEKWSLPNNQVLELMHDLKVEYNTLYSSTSIEKFMSNYISII